MEFQYVMAEARDFQPADAGSTIVASESSVDVISADVSVPGGEG